MNFIRAQRLEDLLQVCPCCEQLKFDEIFHEIKVNKRIYLICENCKKDLLVEKHFLKRMKVKWKRKKAQEMAR